VTKSKDSKRRKAALLGMPVGTAERQLRKAVIHELARQLGKNMCRWCRLEISDPDELALIHVKDWEESPDQYFDLGNVALSHASCAAARGGRRQGEASKMKIEVSVEDAHGNRLPGARHEDQLYVAGKKNVQYQVRVKNRTNERLLVVTTVDGRNVQTGDPGDHQGSGHVLEPHQSWVYKGWRTSDDQVAAFRMGSKEDAYSSQMGSKENVGVIGVAVFEEDEPELIRYIKETRLVPWIVERPAPWQQGQTWISTTDNTEGIASAGSTTLFSSITTSSVQLDSTPHIDSVMCSTTVSGPQLSESSSSRSLRRRQREERAQAKGRRRGRQKTVKQELGTEYGETVTSSVVSTHFNRATEDPCEVHAIRYDSAKALKQRGIMVERPSRRPEAAPQAFPESQQYCAPPPRRRAYKGG